MARYLVTGIAGFIGSSVAAALLAQGHSVLGLDNLSTGNKSNVPKGTVFIQGDCLNDAVYQAPELAKGCDAIFHMAGRDDRGLGLEGPVSDLRLNAESTLRLLNYAEASGCPRFIYRSSVSVYGPQRDVEVTERALPNPASSSGVARLAAEGYLSLFEKRGIGTTALRIFSAYGPVSSLDASRLSLPARYMKMMKEEGHIQVEGSPNRCRDFVHISDVTRAFVACLERPQSVGKVINIGGSGKVMIGELVDRIMALSDKPVTVEYSAYGAREEFGVHADISMAAKYLAYDPEVSLEQGLKDMYDCYGSVTGASDLG